MVVLGRMETVTISHPAEWVPVLLLGTAALLTQTHLAQLTAAEGDASPASGNAETAMAGTRRPGTNGRIVTPGSH